MAEITDELIKKKHKEFNNRIKIVLDELRNAPTPTTGVNPVLEQLRQTVRMRKG